MHHILLALAITGGFLAATVAQSAPAADHNHAANVIQEVAIEVGGVKFWLPSTIVVKKGDHVKIHAVSKIPGAGSVHGFAIDAFKVEAIADEKGKDIEFTADKAGIFPFRCQLHVPHIGGQLVVLE